MSKRPRRNHSPLFKAKVALDAIKGEKTLPRADKLYDTYLDELRKEGLIDGKKDR